MTERTYWLDLFTDKTWREFLASGGNVSGFRAGRKALVSKVKPGDYFLCYLTGVSRFVGLLEVKSAPYVDDSPIWSEEAFPHRLHVEKLIELTAGTGVPLMELRERFTFWNAERPNFWQGKVQGSPNRWDPRDGELIVAAMREAEAAPVERPYKMARLHARARKGKHRARGPKASESLESMNSSPEAPGASPTPTPVTNTAEEIVEDEGGNRKEVRLHSKMEYLLLRLGSSMGLQLWIDQNDRNLVVMDSAWAMFRE